jgi:ATP phosphoribosyltransferase
MCLASLSLGLLNGQQSDSGSWYKTLEELIQDIYVAVSAKNSESVDWQRVRSMFNDEAVVILRTSRDKSTQLSADGEEDPLCGIMHVVHNRRTVSKMRQ